VIIILLPVHNLSNGFQPEPVNGTMRSNMFGYAGAPMPLPRIRPPGTSTISHTFRTPESSTSEEEDRTDLLGRSFQTSSRPKSRSSLAVSIFYCIVSAIIMGAHKNQQSLCLLIVIYYGFK